RINKNLSDFRQSLDHALQTELSSRQGFPVFGFKTFLDLGKEMLLVPALSFQIIKSLSTALIRGFESKSLLSWSLFILAEAIVTVIFFYLRSALIRLLERPSKWRDKINSKWLS